MCIAIARNKGTVITEQTLRNCWDANPHGAGFAYITEANELVVQKFMTFKSFFEAYQVADSFYGETSNFLIHFRITSRGATKIDNCHPFQINGKMAFIHNGTITCMPEDKVHNYSDTYLFNEIILKELPNGWEDSQGVKYLIEDMIGWSKIAVLHVDKGFIIYNEEKGEYFEGNWYSNSTYKDRKVIYSHENYWTNKRNEMYSADSYDYSGYKTVAEREKEKEQAAKEKEDKQLQLIGGTVVVDDTVWCPCAECKSWVEFEDIIPINTTLGEIDLVCVDCIDIMDKYGMHYELALVSDEELEDLVTKYAI